MKIGTHTIGNPLALAPMVGVTDRYFRDLCRSLGAGYVVSEMLAANPALRNSRKARQRSDFVDQQGLVAVQIAGSDPEWMADAARHNAGLGADIVDINMGCPAKKVCNKLAGSALLSDPDKVHAILDAVVGAVDIPVTLKIRTGPDPLKRNGVEIALMAESLGIAALAVHGRTRSDRFKGEAEYATIRNICNAVQIPVFANGDIDSPRKALQVLQETGADGLMIGRAAQGNPWIFREVAHFLRTGEELAPPEPLEVLQVMSGHLQQLHQSYGEQTGVRVARKHIGWYLRDRGDSEATRRLLMKVKTTDEQLKIIADYFTSLQRHATHHSHDGCSHNRAAA